MIKNSMIQMPEFSSVDFKGDRSPSQLHPRS